MVAAIGDAFSKNGLPDPMSNPKALDKPSHRPAKGQA